MSAPTRARPVAPPAADAGPARAAVPWFSALTTGLAVLLAGAPVSAIVSEVTWLGDAMLAVATVVGLGLLLHRGGPVLTVLGQLVGVLLLLTARFGDGALYGVLPGPTTIASFGELVSGAGRQITVGVAPVVPTPEILFLVTGAFGLVAVAVYLTAVLMRAPAAAGVPLLAVFAVPAALSDQLLPWPTMVGACAGFGLLLLARDGAGRQVVGGVALIAVAVALALGIGAIGFVGTAGRFSGTGGGDGAGGAIGLSPFTALRGQLSQNTPQELFHVAGLPLATYLRALTLSSYVPGTGWQPSRPGPGPALPGQVAPDPGDSGQIATVRVTNVGFQDYWLPLAATPLDIDALPGGQWTYDARSGTGYTVRPREDSWQERAALVAPTADDLRAAAGNGSPGPDYLDASGVDSRVVAIARSVVGRRTDAFDKTMALQDYFTGPGTTFRYNLATKPGNGDDALFEFLTTGRQGYCEQFASAMAVMLRTVGVPARVAIGFTAGEPRAGYRSVTTADAHAWVEAWFPGYGWATFDPTPLTDGRTVVPPYVAQAEAQEAGTGADAARNDPALTAPRPPVQDQAAPTPAPSATPDAAAGQDDGGLPVGLLVTLGILLALGGVALTPTIVRAGLRRRRLTAVAAGGPDAAGAGWAEVLAESADREVPPRGSDTVRAAARRLAREHGLDERAQDDLRSIVGAVEASWYGRVHPAPGDLTDAVHGVRAAIAAGSSQTIRAKLFPRSVTGSHSLSTLRARVSRAGSAIDVHGNGDTNSVTPVRTGGGNAPPSDP